MGERAGKCEEFQMHRATPKPWVAATFVVFALQNAVVDRKTNLLRSEAEYGILLPLPKILHESAGFLLFHS